MEFKISTQGHTDVINITTPVAKIVAKSEVSEGIALVFAAHSTVAITTIEYEPGVVEDLKEILEKIIPEEADYKHHQRWHDHNGSAHIRSALLGASLVVPIENGQLALGRWQQIVLIDFDERPRERIIKVKIIKEK